jgi:hypothetical protein
MIHHFTYAVAAGTLIQQHISLAAVYKRDSERAVQCALKQSGVVRRPHDETDFAHILLHLVDGLSGHVAVS